MERHLSRVFRFWLAMALCLASAVIAAPAAAQWEMIGETDESGTPTYTLRTPLEGNRLFQVWCRGTEQQIMLLAYDGEDSTPGASADVVGLEIEVGEGRLWKSPADFYRHSNGWIGLRYRNAQDARSLVEDLIAATSTIGVTMVQNLSGKRYPYTASAKGSTKAGRAFLDKCFGVPAAQPALALSAWEVRQEPDPINGGEQVKLLGDLDQGGYFYAICDGRKRAEVAFVSDDPSTFPYETDDVGLMLRVEIDGEQRSAVGEGFVNPDGLAGIRYAAQDSLKSLLAAVGAAKTEVAMTIESYSSGMVTRWPAVNLQGLAQGVAQFNAHCFGSTAVAADTPVPPTIAPAEQQAVAGWTMQTEASATGPDHTLMASSPDQTIAVLLACDTAGESFLAVEAQPGVLPDAGPATDGLYLYADEQNIPFIAESFSDKGFRYLQSTNVYQVSALVVRLAGGVTELQLKIAPETSAPYVVTLPAGAQAAETARSFAKLCLTPDEAAEIDAVAPTRAIGWELLDGEVAATLEAKAVLRAPASPSGGWVEIRCFAETGMHEVAFFSDDPARQDALKQAFRLEFAVFIGDGFWSIPEANFAYSITDIGVGTTDGETVRQVLAALLQAPPEITVSTRANFDDYQPHKVPLSSSSPVASYLEICPLP